MDSHGTHSGFQLSGFPNRSALLIGLSDTQLPRTTRFSLAHELGARAAAAWRSPSARVAADNVAFDLLGRSYKSLMN